MLAPASKAAPLHTTPCAHLPGAAQRIFRPDGFFLGKVIYPKKRETGGADIGLYGAVRQKPPSSEGVGCKRAADSRPYGKNSQLCV